MEKPKQAAPVPPPAPQRVPARVPAPKQQHAVRRTSVPKPSPVNEMNFTSASETESSSSSSSSESRSRSSSSASSVSEMSMEVEASPGLRAGGRSMHRGGSPAGHRHSPHLRPQNKVRTDSAAKQLFSDDSKPTNRRQASPPPSPKYVPPQPRRQKYVVLVYIHNCMLFPPLFLTRPSCL